jgi:predicted RNase H-like HicB family nuclease
MDWGNGYAYTYINSLMCRAQFEFLPDDGSCYGEIPGIDRFWANAPTLEACRDELRDVLEGWLLLRQQLYKDESV